MNTTKSVCTAFHLNNRRANYKLNIRDNISNSYLPPHDAPKYLGVTLDRSLTYKQHMENTAQKLKKRSSLIRKLAGTNWGASPSTLRTSALALCYSAAEYCAPIWARCAHTNKLDVQLNSTMRIISGALTPTPTEWLPVMASIAPPHLRREEATQKMFQRIATLDDETPLKTVLHTAPASDRLKSRKPFYKTFTPDFNVKEAWRVEWNNKLPPGGNLVSDPTKPLPGFKTLTRKQWVQANRIRSRCGRTAKNLHRWGYRDSPTCPQCKATDQDMDHLILHCTRTAITGGYQTAHDARDEFCNWLAEINPGV